MGFFKQIDILANEIADALVMNPDDVNLSQVTGGWLADVKLGGKNIEGEVKDNPIDAMESLLTLAKSDG